jgi:DNA-binding transcriptional LysR family regulator
MDRVLLTHLPVILAVARTRSFVRAAAELGLGASAVSHAVRAVEDRLGAPLFARTTRSVALTELGAAFLEGATRAAEELDAAVERLREGQNQITGLLRINAPRIALPMGLTRVLAEMTLRYPRLTLEVIADDALTDVVAEGFDAGVRLGEMIAADMVAVRLTQPFRAIMVAAPGYLARAGMPKSIDDLAAHNTIGFRLLSSGAIYAWDLQRAGKDVRIEVNSSVRVSDPASARDLALADVGIAYIFEPLVAADLAAGHLVEVLAEASITEPGLFLYFPQRVSRATKMRALLTVIEDVRATLSKRRQSPAAQRPQPALQSGAKASSSRRSRAVRKS